MVGLSFHICDVICSLLCQQKVYGDYEILKAIGKGKFAVVYRAKRKSDGEIGESSR